VRAKKEKDDSWADSIRREIGEKGYVLRDTPFGAVLTGKI